MGHNVEAYAPVGVLIRITNFKNRYKMKKENTVKNTTKPMAYDALLSTGLVRTLVEATGRFEFVKEEPELSMMTFWDNCWEKEYSIKTDWTLEKLMQWITNFYAEDYEWRGEQKAQRKIRRALGIDD